MTKEKICPNCSIGKMKMENLKGTMFPWRDFPEVELKFDFYSLRCNRCDELFLKGHDLKELDKLIENSIRHQQTENIEKLKAFSKLTQKSLAKKLGITEVYLSELAGGKKTSSLQIFNYIKIVAKDPVSVFDLEKFSCGKLAKMDSSELLMARFTYLSKEEIEMVPQASSFINILSEGIGSGAIH